MKYDHIKQFKMTQYTATAAPRKINEGAHQQNIKNAADYSHYALSATENMKYNFQKFEKNFT